MREVKARFVVGFDCDTYPERRASSSIIYMQCGPSRYSLPALRYSGFEAFRARRDSSADKL